MSSTDADFSNRHPGTLHLLAQFEDDHLPKSLRRVTGSVRYTAVEMVCLLEDGPELTTGLRKLLEAKDCLVRQCVIDLKAQGETPVNTPEPELRG